MIIAGYGNSNPALSRVPIISELTGRTQVEIFLPNSEVVDRLEPHLRECDQLQRLWVHRDKVDSKRQSVLKEKYPDLQFIRYTAAGGGPFP